METLLREHVQINKEFLLLSPKLIKALDTYIVAHNNYTESFQARFSEDCNDTIQTEWLNLVIQFEAILLRITFETCDNLRRAVDTE